MTICLLITKNNIQLKKKLSANGDTKIVRNVPKDTTKKLTEDELIFVEVAFAKYRDRLGYKVFLIYPSLFIKY